MLKITEQKISETRSVLILEGRLTGPWVEAVDLYWREMAPSHRSHAEVNLSGVRFVDAEGRALLTRMWREGATLRATGCLMRCLVEEITGTGKGGSSCLESKPAE